MKDCFLNFVYSCDIFLNNNTQFPAKFELMPQEEASKYYFLYSSKNPSGTIDAFSKKSISLDIQIRRLGALNANIFCKIIGNGNDPLCTEICATGIGPEVNVSQNEISWGKIEVLTPTNRIFTLNNTSAVVANFSCAIMSDTLTFTVEPLSGKILPGSSCEITITAFLEDTIKFTDVLKVSVEKAPKIHEIKLNARGEGTTIVFNEALRCVNFGDVFSNCDCVAEFIITNKGKRSQNLNWFKEDNVRISGNIRGSKELQSESYFEVIPSRFTLKPGTQQTIIIKGTAHKALFVEEKLCCQAVLEKDPQRRVILESMVMANFINPYSMLILD
jgi:hypothetical protein